MYLAGEFLCPPVGPPGAQCTSLAKLAADGTTLWMSHVTAAKSFEHYDRRIAVDSSGSVYVADSFAGIATFNGTTITNSYENTEDVYVAKHDTDGNLLWVRQYGGPGDQHSYDVAVVPSGGVYVCGISREDDVSSGFLLRYDSNGQLLWSHRESGEGSFHFLRLAPSASGILHASGKFAVPFQLGSHALNGIGRKDIFLTRMDVGSEIMRPALRIAVSNGQVVLRWPAWAMGFHLEDTVDFGPNRIWNAVDASPSIERADFVLTNTMTGLSRFYRLRKP